MPKSEQLSRGETDKEGMSCRPIHYSTTFAQRHSDIVAQDPTPGDRTMPLDVARRLSPDDIMQLLAEERNAGSLRCLTPEPEKRRQVCSSLWVLDGKLARQISCEGQQEKAEIQYPLFVQIPDPEMANAASRLLTEAFHLVRQSPPPQGPNPFASHRWKFLPQGKTISVRFMPDESIRNRRPHLYLENDDGTTYYKSNNGDPIVEIYLRSVQFPAPVSQEASEKFKAQAVILLAHEIYGHVQPMLTGHSGPSHDRQSEISAKRQTVAFIDRILREARSDPQRYSREFVRELKKKREIESRGLRVKY